MSDKGPGLSRALPKYEGGCYEGMASHPTATFPPGKCPHDPISLQDTLDWIDSLT